MRTPLTYQNSLHGLQSLLFCLFWFFLAMPLLTQASDLETVEQRIKTSVLASVPSAITVNGYQSSLQADGRWTDINYAQTAQTNWQPITHLDRLHAMARAYAASSSSLYQNGTLKTNILKAYDYWLSSDPQSTNWYHNEIATPQRLGEIMILIKSDLSAAQKTSGLTVVARSYVPRATNSGTNTGANRIDRAYPSLIRGLLTPNASLVSESFLAIGDTIIVTTAEGIQPDYSYQQHGAQLYIAGYGSVFIGGITRYGLFGAGTSYGFSAAQIRTLVDFATEGLPWFIRGNTIDYTASGRGLTRKGSTATANGVASQLNSLLSLNNGYRSTELLKLKDRFQTSQTSGTADPAKAQNGNRYFWRSDAMTHHRPVYSISVKTSSTRTLQPESGNGEGLKNFHLGDGVTLIQRTGNEYDEIMPVWDWRRLPGTTTEQRNYSLKPSSDWGVAGTSTFAGGASDGKFGVSAFQYNRLNVAAKKSWFFFDQEMVALGAALNATATANSVQTSLNQTLQNGGVTYQTGTNAVQTLATGSVTPANLNWVHHDQVGYRFFTPVSTAKIQATAQSGTWESINDSYDATLVTKNVFSLDLGHGTTVSNGSYAYSVIPGMTAEEMPSYHAANPVQVLSNTSAIQAVKHSGLGVTAATFWNDGTSTIDGITVNKKSCVVVKNDGQFLDVAISDPTQTNTGTITLQLTTSAGGVISSDAAISVTQTTPGVSLTVAVNGSRGKSFRARFYLSESAMETISFPPVADSYVYDASPNSNYGTANGMIVKKVGTGYDRASFLRFDLNQPRILPLGASLRLVPTGTSTPGTHALAAVSDDTWSETGINWNNQPETETVCDTWVPVASIPVRIPVTNAVIDALYSDKLLSLGLYTATSTSDGYVTYATREHSNMDYRPQLTLTYLTNAPLVTVAAITPTVNENGGAPGKFRLNRTGDLAGELTVQFSISGTASADAIQLSSTTATFASGEATSEVTIMPVNNATYDGNRTVTLVLALSTQYTLGNNSTATLILLDDEKSPNPFIAWLDTHPPLLQAADRSMTADPDRDGWNNMLEFALHSLPDAQDASYTLHPKIGNQALLLTIAVRTSASFHGDGDLISDPIDGIVYKIQASRDLNDFVSQTVTEVSPAHTEGLSGLPAGWTYRTFSLPQNEQRGFLRISVEPAP